MKAELYKHNDTKVLELTDLDEILIGMQKLVFLSDGDAVALDKCYNKDTGEAFRLVVDGVEEATDERIRIQYDRHGTTCKRPL